MTFYSKQKSDNFLISFARKGFVNTLEVAIFINIHTNIWNKESKKNQ